MRTRRCDPVMDAAHGVQRSREAEGVAIVGTFLSSSGLNQSVCEQLAERLENVGWRVIRTSTRPQRVARFADILGTLWGQRNRYSVAQVDVYSGPAFVWAAAAVRLLRRLDKPCILTLHGGNLPTFCRRYPKLVRSTLSQATAVTAPSNYLRSELQSCHSGIDVLPNPIELSLYPRKQQIGHVPKLIWVRAFSRIYNPLMAVDVLHGVRQKHGDTELIMIGPDKGDGSLAMVREHAARLGLSDQVRIVPGLPKTAIPEALVEGDIFLNTTNIDNTPVSVIEAMACGLPAVSTNVGGLPYLLEDGKTGLLSEPSDVTAMVKSVCRLLDNPPLRHLIGHNAREAARQSDWSRVLPRWTSLLERVSHAACI